MSTTISINDLPSDIRERLERIASGDTIVVVSDKGPLAEIRPLPQPETPESLAAKFAALPHLTPEEAESFGRDIEEGRRWLDQLPVGDPWED
jgi:antitoxin (DNA-binding transcriptional repressor) of toxin-antitoxin stability system